MTLAPAKEFRHENVSGANYERAFSRWTSNVWTLGTEKGGTGTAREFRVSVGTAPILGTESTQLRLYGNVWVSAGSVGSSVRTLLQCATTSGVLLLTDNSTVSFGRLQLGGTGTSHPAIKRNGTEVHIRLANDSDFAGLSVAQITLGVVTVGTLPAAASNTYAQRAVSDANAPTVGATVAGGGSAKAIVRSNGTNWIITEVI